MNKRTSALLAISLVVGVATAAGRNAGLTAESRPYRTYIASAARDGMFIPVPTAPASDLPPAPQGWPATFGLGLSDAPGGGAGLAQEGFQFRYQYLAGGANTGNGWQSWESNGQFVEDYIRESTAAGISPVFSYYMVRQSEPGAAMSEQAGVLANLASDSTMNALFADLAAFFRSASAASNGTVVLHFEPDLWGFLQQQADNNDASGVPVSVGSSGAPELSGLPDTAAGLARAVLALRDRYAPNVLVAYHYSTWGSGVDHVYADVSKDDLVRMSARSTDFYKSLGANFDLTFAEMSDRDAGFKQEVYGDGGASWWDASDFSNHLELMSMFVRSTGLRVVLWQIPLGNTLMRSMDNTWGHYQDNKVEWLLGGSDFPQLRSYMAAGVLALLFGRGADGATCACDAAADGVTNPTPINGNDRIATSADDDGGYFRERVAAFASASEIPLP
ncbi:MAG: hypothetical protein AB7J35_09470 [Dehalococcoidia bacterium]